MIVHNAVSYDSVNPAQSPNWTLPVWSAKTTALVVVLLTLVGGVLRGWALGAKTLWLDEAFSLWMASQSPADLVRWVVQIDHHPPLYYLALHGWLGWLGDSAAAARGLSALAGTLAIPVFFVAARRLTGPRIAVGATILVALSPFLVRYGQEARMYSLLTLAFAATLAATAWLLTDPMPTRGRAVLVVMALGIAEAAAMWLHNTATILLPVALNIGVLGPWITWRLGRMARPWPAQAEPGWLWRWLAAQGLALALWLPGSGAFLVQSRVVDAHFWMPPPTPGFVWETLSNLTFAYLPASLPLRALWPVLGLWLAWRGLRATSRWPGLPWLLAALWLTPPLAELAVSVRRPIFYDRTLIWTILPYALLMARGVLADEPASALRWRRPALLTGVVAVILSGVGAGNYLATYEKEAWDQAAAVVRAGAAPGDLILFHASWVQLPFDTYFGTADDTVARHGLPVDLFDRGELEPTMTAADLPRLDALIAGRDQVWLVYAHWWYTDPDGLAPRALAARLRLAQEWSWDGLRVMRFVAR